MPNNSFKPTAGVGPVCFQLPSAGGGLIQVLGANQEALVPMANKITKFSWLNVSCFLLVAAVAATSIVIAPLWAHRIYLSNQPPRLPAPSIQSEIENGSFIFSEEKLEPFPYESISLERTPCFGPCPVYLVTFYKDGKATLVTDHLLREKRQSFAGQINPYDYARLCQMVDSARNTSRKSDYSGQWTDDYSAIIVAKTATRTWHVSDYGQVAPLPIWVLEEMLHSYRQSIEWHRTGA